MTQANLSFQFLFLGSPNLLWREVIKPRKLLITSISVDHLSGSYNLK